MKTHNLVHRFFIFHPHHLNNILFIYFYNILSIILIGLVILVLGLNFNISTIGYLRESLYITFFLFNLLLIREEVEFLILLLIMEFFIKHIINLFPINMIAHPTILMFINLKLLYFVFKKKYKSILLRLDF